MDLGMLPVSCYLAVQISLVMLGSVFPFKWRMLCCIFDMLSGLVCGNFDFSHWTSWQADKLVCWKADKLAVDKLKSWQADKLTLDTSRFSQDRTQFFLPWWRCCSCSSTSSLQGVCVIECLNKSMPGYLFECFNLTPWQFNARMFESVKENCTWHPPPPSPQHDFPTPQPGFIRFEQLSLTPWDHS